MLARTVFLRLKGGWSSVKRTSLQEVKSEPRRSRKEQTEERLRIQSQIATKKTEDVKEKMVADTKSVLKRKMKKKKVMRKVRKPGVEPVEQAMQYAGKLLSQVPKRWMQQSSVVKEAAGMSEDTAALEGATQKILMELDRNQPLFLEGEGGSRSLTDFTTALDKQIEVLEKKAAVIRHQSGATEPTLADSEAYLRVITKAPSGVEALTWLDEVEMTRPEWVTPAHYEIAFLHAVNREAPVCERDILVLWAKARRKDMVTPQLWTAMVANLGFSSLRHTAFEFLYDALKSQYGAGGVPAEVCHGVFMHCKDSNDPRKAIRVFMELTSAGCRIGLLSYLEIVSLLTRNVDMSNDQEVLDYMLECTVQEAEEIVSTEGIEGIPRVFFSRALTSCSPSSAVRLWKFMQLHGIRVTYEDYRHFLDVMISGKKLHEAELIYRYLEKNHPEYLWKQNSKIPLNLLKVYLKYPGNEATARSIFSTHFGPQSNAPPSPTAYLLMMRHAKDPHLVHNLYTEMLARGVVMETEMYNKMFVSMGGSVDGLTHKIEYTYPVSILDEDIPQAVKDLQVGVFETHPSEPKPPPQLGAHDPYSSAPSLIGMRNVPIPHQAKYGETWYPKVAEETKPYSVKEQPLPDGFVKVDKVMKDGAYAAVRRSSARQKSAADAAKRRQEEMETKIS